MPYQGEKSVTVKERQWKAVKKLVELYPQVAGRNVGEFYRIAAQERILSLIQLLKIPPDQISTILDDNF